jgi:HEPN domain-containing protein
MPDDKHKAWIVRANQDLLSIKNNLVASDVPWNVVVYHAHQAAEKYLKGFLISRSVLPDLVHSLSSLLLKCCELDASLEELRHDCRFLDRYGITARYPDRSPEIGEELGRLSFEASARVCSRIQTLLPADPA